MRLLTPLRYFITPADAMLFSFFMLIFMLIALAFSPLRHAAPERAMPLLRFSPCRFAICHDAMMFSLFMLRAIIFAFAVYVIAELSPWLMLR